MKRAKIVCVCVEEDKNHIDTEETAKLKKKKMWDFGKVTPTLCQACFIFWGKMSNYVCNM